VGRDFEADRRLLAAPFVVPITTSEAAAYLRIAADRDRRLAYLAERLTTARHSPRADGVYMFAADLDRLAAVASGRADVPADANERT